MLSIVHDIVFGFAFAGSVICHLECQNELSTAGAVFVALVKCKGVDPAIVAYPNYEAGFTLTSTFTLLALYPVSLNLSINVNAYAYDATPASGNTSLKMN